MKRTCPCGEPLVRKPNESQKAFENRRHCNAQHRGKYHHPGPAKRGFGLEVPVHKDRHPVSPGLHAYITSRTV